MGTGRPSVHAKSARTTARLWLLPYVCVVDKSKHGPIPAARPEPDFLHVSWLGWLLIPADSVCMRRRQVETWSDLGRPPDPTFCMYLSPVDTSINRPPVRPCKVRPHHRPTMVASVRMRRRQVETWSDPGRPTRTRLSACIMVRMATHTGRFRMYASPTSRNMVRSRPAARPDFLHVSVARRHIDKWAARPTVRPCKVRPTCTTARLWLLPYVCVVDKLKHGPIPPDPTFCMYHG